MFKIRKYKVIYFKTYVKALVPFLIQNIPFLRTKDT